MAEWNRKNKEELKAKGGNNKEKQESSVSSTQCYGIGAIIVVAGVVFVVYRVWGNPFKKGKDVSSNPANIASTYVVEPSQSKTKCMKWNKFSYVLQNGQEEYHQ